MAARFGKAAMRRTVVGVLLISVFALVAIGKSAAGVPTPPSITMTPAVSTNQTSASFSYTDAQVVTKFQCALDTSVFGDCGTTRPSSKAYTGLGAGTHTFQVRAIVDTRTSSATTVSWTVDTSPPPAPLITSAPPEFSPSTKATFTFTGLEVSRSNARNGSDNDAALRFRCRLDGSPFTACASPAAYSGLTQGSHTFDVESLDPASNPSTITSQTWMVDTIAPVVSFTQTPPKRSATTATTFTWNGTDGSGSGIASTTCRVDAGKASACVSPLTIVVTAGTHTFSVVAMDRAGNPSATITKRWIVTGVRAGLPYTVSGNAAALLYPGAAPSPINLTFSNPNVGNGGSGADGVRVANLTVAISSVSAPNARTSTPCTIADFAVTQFSGEYPFLIPSGLSSLQSLGFAQSTWPGVRLIDRPVNQDGCKGATITLSYDGAS